MVKIKVISIILNEKDEFAFYFFNTIFLYNFCTGSISCDAKNFKSIRADEKKCCNARTESSFIFGGFI